MTAIDKSLLTEILDGVTAVHKYLTEDLVNEHLSANANLRRQALSETMGTISQKIQSTHPTIRPRVNTPGNLSQTHQPQKPPLGQKPPTAAHKPPPIGQKPPIAGPKPIPGQKPPLASKPLPMPAEEEQEMYEVPVIDDIPREPEAETYLDFEPSSTAHDADEPQEEYTDMQTEEGRIEEEMYEDPSLVQQEDNTVSSQVPIEEEQDMYEEPSISVASNDPPVRVTLSPPPSQPPPPVPTVPSSESEAGYMDPRITRNGTQDGNIPESISIEDWASAYDTSFKKGEKVRPSELKDVIKRGWIEKLGGRSQKSWQKRFCAISSVFMYFYEKDYSRTYNNRVVVPGYVVNQAPDLTNPKKKQFAFKMTATDGSGLGKDYYFRTGTEQDREEWIGALRATYKIGQIGQNPILEEATKRLSVTLPRAPRVTPPIERAPRPSSVVEQENYEALETVMDEGSQEDYVDVTEQVKEKDGEEQEEYVDLQPAHQIAEEEEDQDEYTVPPEFAYPSQPQPLPQMARPPPQPRPLSSVVSPPPPQPQPRPSSSVMSPPPPPIQRTPLPPPPPAAVPPPAAPLAPAPPVAALPSQLQPVKHAPSPATDIHVDTSIIYTQQKNGILFNKVYVVLWDFAGHESDELPLKRGNLVLVDDPTPGRDWWFGELLDSTASKKEGATGLFPSTYTTVAFECVS